MHSSPTMGALHRGHLSLVEIARSRADRVVASIFVNPTQFGSSEDLQRYPRTLSSDFDLLAAAGCDLIFHPAGATVYPEGSSVWIEPGPAALGLEGARATGDTSGVLQPS